MRLGRFLQSRQAKVLIVLPEAVAGDGKLGLDDYLAGGGKLVELLATGMTPGAAEALLDRRETVDVSDPPLELKARALDALEAFNEPPVIFVQGGHFARLSEDEPDQWRIETLTPPMLRHRLEEVLKWERVTKAAVFEVPPPQHIIEDLLVADQLAARLPILDGVVTSPCFATDGSLIATDGYHELARVFMSLGDLELGDLPTLEEAKTLILDELLVDFPFVSEADRTHAVGLLLLPLVRSLIEGTTPLHLIGSPEPGTGKGLLADILLICVSATSVARMAPALDDAEWRKRLTAVLAEGNQVLLIDNLVGRLDSASLASALTSPFWRDRKLGHTRMLTFPNRAIWVGTGNNVTMTGEIARRTVHIRLDANTERPWKRDDFRHRDLRAWVAEHRGELVAAAIAIVEAWLRNGRPLAEIAFGDFGSWAKTIGGILTNTGFDGFLANADERFDEADAEREDLERFVTAWWVECGVDPVTARELASSPEISRTIESGSGTTPARALGYLLRHNRDRIIDGKKITAAGKDRMKVSLWRLEPVAPRESSPAPDSTETLQEVGAAGDAGDLPSDFPVESLLAMPLQTTGQTITRITREDHLTRPFTAGDATSQEPTDLNTFPELVTNDSDSDSNRCELCGAKFTGNSISLQSGPGRVASKLAVGLCVECALV